MIILGLRRERGGLIRQFDLTVNITNDGLGNEWTYQGQCVQVIPSYQQSLVQSIARVLKLRSGLQEYENSIRDFAFLTSVSTMRRFLISDVLDSEEHLETQDCKEPRSSTLSCIMTEPESRTASTIRTKCRSRAMEKMHAPHS